MNERTAWKAANILILIKTVLLAVTDKGSVAESRKIVDQLLEKVSQIVAPPKWVLMSPKNTDQERFIALYDASLRLAGVMDDYEVYLLYKEAIKLKA